jgi:hypothetical protein
MQPSRWKLSVSFVEGVVISFAVHTGAWITFLSADAAWKFVGHVAGVIGLQVFFSGS